MLRKLRASLPSWAPGSTRYRSPIDLKTGDRRVYHVHVRKTAGTSINHAFLRLAGEGDAERYAALAKLERHELDADGFRFVGWDAKLINRGNYFYAFSHLPFWQLSLPPKTYLLTCLRDPVKRVLSHYQMLSEYRDKNLSHACRATEEPWLGDSLLDFIERMPAAHLLNQLWMFSKRLDVEEALGNLRRMSRVLFNEDLASGVEVMSRDLGLPLAVDRRGQSSPLQFDPAHVDALRSRLDPEYRLIAAVRREWNGQA